jgi:hypothetical protein
MHNAKEKAALSNYSCASYSGRYAKLFSSKYDSSHQQIYFLAEQ